MASGNSYNEYKKHKPTMDLVTAVQKGDETKLKSALAGGACPKVTVSSGTGSSWCMLTAAANQDHSHLISHLLQAGLKVDGEGTHERTPLMEAAFMGRTKTLKTLITLGANPSLKDKAGNTALRLAVMRGHKQCVAALIPVSLPEEIHIAAKDYDYTDVCTA